MSAQAKTTADIKGLTAAIQGRRRQLALESRMTEQRERTAQAEGLAQARATAARHGVAVDTPTSGQAGPIVTARDGFTWLCGSSRRKAQLSEAQIAAGLRHRALADRARSERLTADYGRLAIGAGSGGRQARAVNEAAETERLGRRMDALRRLARGEEALLSAHPALATVVRRVVGDGATLSVLAAETDRAETAVLEVLRMGLDKLAEVYGFRLGAADPQLNGQAD